MIRSTLFSVVAGLCALSAAPATAQSSGEAPRAVIRYADLDLGSQAGQEALRMRGTRAIRSACNVRSGGLQSLVIAQRCRDDLSAQLDVKVAALIGNRGLQRYAQAGMLAISLR